MSRKISRRGFLKTGSLIGASSLIIPASLKPEASKSPGIAVVQGNDSFASTAHAVSKLGGMEKFVRPGYKVAILANAQRNNPGAYTHPDIVRSVILLCRESNASQIDFLTWLPESNWENTGLKKAIESEGARLIVVGKEEDHFRPVPVKKGVSLKEARIMENYFQYDAFINMPIIKDHAGNKFTGTLKNLMGLNSPENNRTFHKPNWTSDPEAIHYLDQCIADLNTVVRPTLCVVDATEFITTNGPFGPGELLRPQKVVAGVDRVAIDAYCSTLWGLDPRRIHTITCAYEHGLGEIDVKKAGLKEFKLLKKK